MSGIWNTLAIVGLAAGITSANDDFSREYASMLRADAATRDSLEITNGEASLKISGYMQYRYVASFSDGYSEDVITGFDLPRIRLGVGGQLTDKIAHSHGA